MFAPDLTLEQFATGLFNEWGIGDKTSNDGVLVLILKTDRAMRIELGGSYERDWDRTAATVINRSFLPAFKEDRYQDGIEAGVSDTIETIVTPFLAGAQAPKGESNNWVWAIVMAVLGGIGAMAFKDKFVKLQKCPECGQRHLNRTRHIKRHASKTSTGDGDMITECSNCSYRSVVPYTISRKSSSASRSSFGGGSSGGGGASGRW
ncbi:MAG: TPM domain-containing protein [Planktotalea sp.]|uniref:TPM domain-containing protein n=1 Tax=Planktotalea sp. TaxID=2029877 RepID=UPI003C70F9A8